MQKNMLNDLAEAMKALDGKKEMFRSCEDNTYIIVIVIYRSYI